MEYHVNWPDYDYVVGTKHKLMPSIIGDMKALKSKDLSNNQPAIPG